MPYGCGEQNMALLAPNIYILHYLKNTDQLTPAILDKATNFLNSGESEGPGKQDSLPLSSNKTVCLSQATRDSWTTDILMVLSVPLEKDEGTHGEKITDWCITCNHLAFVSKNNLNKLRQSTSVLCWELSCTYYPMSLSFLTFLVFRLTAFVMRTFAKAKTFIYIDPKVIKKTKSWLKQRQQENGCFQMIGTLFNNRMKVNLLYMLWWMNWRDSRIYLRHDPVTTTEKWTQGRFIVNIFKNINTP